MTTTRPHKIETTKKYGDLRLFSDAYWSLTDLVTALYDQMRTGSTSLARSQIGSDYGRNASIARATRQTREHIARLASAPAGKPRTQAAVEVKASGIVSPEARGEEAAGSPYAGLRVDFRAADGRTYRLEISEVTEG